LNSAKPLDVVAGSTPNSVQADLNLKSVISGFAGDTIVSTIPAAWKDTRLSVGLGTETSISMRSYAKTLAKGVLTQPTTPTGSQGTNFFTVSRSDFVELAAALFGRYRGSDRRIMMRNGKYVAQEIQYTMLLQAVNKVPGLNSAQRNALSMWLTVVLQDAAGLAKWGGPVDLIMSRKQDERVASRQTIHTEFLVWKYATYYETSLKAAFAPLNAFLSDKVGYYDVQTIAEYLFINWTSQQVDVRRESAIFVSREHHFMQAVGYLLNTLPVIPDPLSSIGDLEQFLRIANFVADVDLSQIYEAPKSFAEARSYIQTVRSLCASPNTKVEIVPTVSLSAFFNVRTSSFKAGVDSSDLKTISLNYAQAEVVRAGEMVSFIDGYYQWSEDPAISSFLTTLLKTTLTNLSRVEDVRTEVWATTVDNVTDITFDMSEADVNRTVQLSRLAKLFALAACSWLVRGQDGFIFGIMQPNNFTGLTTDAAYSVRGTTTKNWLVATALLLSEREGTPYITSPSPFYKGDARSFLLATSSHYRQLAATGVNEPPTFEVQVIDTDGASFTANFPFATIVPGAYTTTSAVIHNASREAKAAYLASVIEEALLLDPVLTGELLVPILRDLAKTAYTAFGKYVEGEILAFPVGMSAVRRNMFKAQVTLNSINVYLEVLRLAEPTLADLINALFTFVFQDATYNKTVLGIL